MAKVTDNLVNKVIASITKDKTNIIKASRKIDTIREKFGTPEKEFNSTVILRELRESKIR